jgi:glycosyltransferase involved in cell wall biosynthesis
LARGVDLEVFTTSANGEEDLPLNGRRQFEGVPVCYFQRGFPRRSFGASGMRQALKAKLPLVDLVHLHGLWNVPVWMSARECIATGVPFIVSPRGMLDSGSMAYHRLRKECCFWIWERRYLKRASLLHVTSRREAETLERLSLGPSIVNIPNGVSPPSAEEGANAESPASAPVLRTVLYLGRLHRTKRIDLVVGAMDLVKRRYPGSRLVLAGPPDGLDVARILQSVAWRGEVQVLGQVDDRTKWRLLADASVLVLCSDSESFGMTVVEALSIGTPVVATRTCPWEDLERERCGFWVEQRAKDVSDAILRVLEDPDEARAMGDRGRALVRNRYAWSAVARDMIDHYQQVVSSVRE